MHLHILPPRFEALMFPKPKSDLKPNTYAYESSPLVKPTGFREYDARWLLEKEINLMGVQALGMGLGTLIREMGVKQEIVTGHDFRGYSASVKMALVSGLMAAGCKVHDIGLSITPMAYFAQFDLNVPCVAMVTASHNDNGWTGVKMGANRPLTFGPNEMKRLKEIVLEGKFELRADGALGFDGDGDRCGVVDNEGEEIFADKVGVLLARDMSSLHKNSTFVVDVKSTGLFLTDPVLKANGVKADYWKTGHSYIKRRVNELGALAGFEKSGHFFFNKPYGRGYDDGMIFALAVCDMLDRNPAKSMADLRKALPKTWGSPTMAPHCDDEKKYGVVDLSLIHISEPTRQ